MTCGVAAPPRGAVRLVAAVLLAVALFEALGVTLLVLASGVFAGADAEQTLGAIVFYDVLVVVAALVALRIALRLTRPGQQPVLALDESERAGLAVLGVGVAPAVLYVVAGVISRGAGLFRLILDVVALVVVGTWVALRENDRGISG